MEERKTALAMAQSWELVELGGEYPPTPWDGASLTQSLDQA